MFASIGSAAAASELLKKDTWVTDGPVHAIASDGQVTYIGGAFSYVGPRTGGGVPIVLQARSPKQTYPQVDGEIGAVVSDGAGGWYTASGQYSVFGFQ